MQSGIVRRETETYAEIEDSIGRTAKIFQEMVVYYEAALE